MQIEVTSGELAEQDVDTLVVSLPEGSRRLSGAARALNTALGGTISDMIGARAIRLGSGTLTPVPVSGDVRASRVFVHGLGDRSKLTPRQTRSQAGDLARALRGADAGSVALWAHPDWVGSDVERGGQSIAEGITLGLYRFDEHHTREADRPSGNVASVRIVESSERRATRLRNGAERGADHGRGREPRARPGERAGEPDDADAHGREGAGDRRGHRPGVRDHRARGGRAARDGLVPLGRAGLAPAAEVHRAALPRRARDGAASR